MARSFSSSTGSFLSGLQPRTPQRPSRLRGVGVGFALALCVPWGASPVAGQERSVLSLLDTEGRVLAVGETEQGGELTSNDFVTGSGQRVQAWALEGVSGPVQVDLISNDFDAYLYVLPGDGGAVLEDDDSAGDLNSRVCLDEAGGYTVVAGSLGGEMGSFSIEVTPDPEGLCTSDMDWGFQDEGEIAEALAAVVSEGSLEVPGTETFRFDGSEPRAEGRPLRAWTFQGQQGERFALTHRSPGVDTYLYLTGPGLTDVLRDDDSGGDFDARLCLELPQSGEYTVYAAPFDTDDLGALHRLETASAADAEMACDGSFASSPAVLVERLLAMDAAGRAIAVGEEEDGVLTLAQSHPESGEPLQPWRLDAAPGTRVFVDVVSDDFDATVRVAWPGLEETLFNDDSGPGCNSRIDFMVPADGPVVVFPGSWSSSGQGAFLLRVSTDPGPLEDGGCGGGDLDLGEDFGGGFGAGSAAWEMVGRFAAPTESLTLGTEQEVMLDQASTSVIQGVRARAWEVTFQEPGGWIVEASSDEVDPVLYVMGPSLNEPLFDDDSGGSLNARIEVPDAEPGSWVIVVGALSGAEGPVRVRVLRRGGS